VRKSAGALAPAFDLITLDFSNAPPVERKALETKKKEKPAKSTETNASSTPTQTVAESFAANKAESAGAKPSKKKEKQDAAVEKDGKKKAANNAGATSTAAEDAGSPIPSMIDLRVGHIIEGLCAH
jgi:aminoacyl tRNA synthase complex-interacting multifunctional protein 1